MLRRLHVAVSRRGPNGLFSKKETTPGTVRWPRVASHAVVPRRRPRGQVADRGRDGNCVPAAAAHAARRLYHTVAVVDDEEEGAQEAVGDVGCYEQAGPGATAASHDAVDATRVHLTSMRVVSLSSLGPFGPRRGVAAMASTRCHAASAPSRRWRVGKIHITATPSTRSARETLAGRVETPRCSTQVR